MKLMKNKKGFVQLLAPLLASGWVLLGAAIFAILILLGFFFALPTLLAAAMIAVGLIVIFKGGNPYVGFILIAIGALIIWNPFEGLSQFLAVKEPLFGK